MASEEVPVALQMNSTALFSVFDPRGFLQSQSAAAAADTGCGGGDAAAAAAAATEAEVDPIFRLTGREWKVSTLSLDDRFAICRSVGEECIQDAELRTLLEKKPHPVCYDGFEPSGRVHIAQGVLRTINVNKLTSAGCIFKFWVADWFALLNNKMGGDLKKIRTVGRYMIEVWRSAGMDMDNVAFLWASDEINRKSDEYWSKVMDVARRFNLARIQRCCTIMGRKETDEMSAAQIMYPCMQCTDVFFLGADICQLGMDQRKVNMLAREYCDETKPKIKHKPVIISHHMLLGLKEGQEKMSKSDPDSAIFMEDTAADVKRKVKKAFCPPPAENTYGIGAHEKTVDGVTDVTTNKVFNPVIDYMQHIIFQHPNHLDAGVTIKRKPENGGDKTYASFDELSADYSAGNIHPGDLKATLVDALNAILQPVRDHFTTNKEAKQLLALVKKYRVTR